MRISSIIHLPLNLLWGLIAILMLASKGFSILFRSAFSELRVYLTLKLHLPKKTYHIIKNVRLPTETSSKIIDYIIVSRYGLFMIQTKNMKGWIYAGQNQKQWTHKLHKRTRLFPNPLHESFDHIISLEGCLNIDVNTIQSVIVFDQNCEFKTTMPANATKARGCVNYIKLFSKKIYNENQVQRLVADINRGHLTNNIRANREHVQHVRDIFSKRVQPKAR